MQKLSDKSNDCVTRHTCPNVNAESKGKERNT